MAPQQPLQAALVGGRHVTVGDAAQMFLADCRSRNLSPCTLAINAGALAEFTASLDDKPLDEVTADDLRRFIIEKATATSPATAARHFNCIAAAFNFLSREGLIRENPASQVKRPKVPEPVIQPLSQDQVEAMLDACGNGNRFVALRNRLVLLILIDCGLRASELCGLTLADVDLENQQFLVRHGKGGRSRRVPFGKNVLAAMQRYLSRRAEVDTPNLIVNVYGGPVGRYRLRHIVTSIAERAGVKHPHMGPHLLRHTFAVSYLRAGGDTFSLQKILGHSTLVMTRRYAELADSDVAEKHRLFSPADKLTLPSDGRRRRLR